MCKPPVYTCKLPVYMCKPSCKLPVYSKPPVYMCKLAVYIQAKTVLTFQIVQIIQGEFTKGLLINTAY